MINDGSGPLVLVVVVVVVAAAAAVVVVVVVVSLNQTLRATIYDNLCLPCLLYFLAPCSPNRSNGGGVVLFGSYPHFRGRAGRIGGCLLIISWHYHIYI